MAPNQSQGLPHSNGHRNPRGAAGDVKALLRQARIARPLQPSERDTLLERAARGDRGSRDRLVEVYLEQVIRLATRRTGQGLALADLVQEGSIGLLEAIRSFGADATQDFDVYAAARINAQLDLALTAEAAAVREAELLVAAATDYERVELQLSHALGRRPTEREIAEKLEWTIERLREVAEMVAEARKRHDEELLAYIDLDDIDVDGVL